MLSYRDAPTDDRSAPPPMAGRSFFSLAPSSFLYPFRTGGALRLFLGSIVIWVGFLAGSMMGPQSLALNGPMLGYFAMFLIDIANASGDGRDDMPGWPSFSKELVSEFIMLILAVLICLAPAIIYTILIAFYHAPIDYLIIAFYASWFFTPMALIRVCMLQSLEGVKPIPVITSIFRVLTPYIGLCLILTFVQFIQGMVQSLCALVPYAGLYLKSLALFYFLILQMRIFGVFYFVYRKKLAWFDHFDSPYSASP